MDDGRTRIPLRYLDRCGSDLIARRPDHWDLGRELIPIRPASGRHRYRQPGKR